jgi:hypothetical protein
VGGVIDPAEQALQGAVDRGEALSDRSQAAVDRVDVVHNRVENTPVLFV